MSPEHPDYGQIRKAQLLSLQERSDKQMRLLRKRIGPERAKHQHEMYLTQVEEAEHFLAGALTSYCEHVGRDGASKVEILRKSSLSFAHRQWEFAVSRYQTLIAEAEKLLC